MNADNETLATIKVDIPDDKNVNVIEPFGSVTKKFFDRDEKTWEVMVFIPPYITTLLTSGMANSAFTTRAAARLCAHTAPTTLCLSTIRRGSTLISASRW